MFMIKSYRYIVLKFMFVRPGRFVGNFQIAGLNFLVQCNLNLVIFDLVTTCDLLSSYYAQTIFQFTTQNHYINFMQFCDSYCGQEKCH